MGLLEDSTFWLLISFVIFCFILLKAGKSAFLGLLDERIDAIKNDISRAENLRIEAQEMLAQYQRKHRDAVQEADEIIRKAAARAKDIREASEKDLEELIARREAQLQQRLSRMEQAAVADIQKYTADLAIKATREIIADQLDKASNDALIDNAIESLSKTLK